MIFRRILIANRGEIAARLIRTCRRLGIETALTVAGADEHSLPAALADRTVRLESGYLDVAGVVAAAVAAGAGAVHPGYGFLAENPRLARACEAAGLVFIGPSADVLETAGDKLAARDHAVAAGVPVLPGGPADAESGARIGYPVLVKAVAGGGGRGQRLAADPASLPDSVALASAEAAAAFGDSRVYLERYVGAARHVEVQLLGDGERLIHLGDRDCSVQRRQQKVIEEAPAPALDPALRADLHAAAVSFGTQLKYQGLGTVEFLVETGSAAFWFLEMNPRIQVEHPVTEAVTGLDLVAEQIAIAEGRGLRMRQLDIALDGHAIECRITAEHPGTITTAEFPAGPGIRVDTHVQAGSAVPPQYDGLLAKLIVSGACRDEALARLRTALARCRIDGVATTIGLHAAVAADPEFTAGGVDTGYLSRFLAINHRSLCELSSWIPRSATATRACGARPACAPRTSWRSRRC